MSGFSTDWQTLDVREWQTRVSDRHEQTKTDSQEKDGHAKHIRRPADREPALFFPCLSGVTDADAYENVGFAGGGRVKQHPDILAVKQIARGILHIVCADGDIHLVFGAKSDGVCGHADDLTGYIRKNASGIEGGRIVTDGSMDVSTIEGRIRCGTGKDQIQTASRAGAAAEPAFGSGKIESDDFI